MAPRDLTAEGATKDRQSGAEEVGMVTLESRKGKLVRLAVERLAAAPEEEQRFLELSFALGRAVTEDLRYDELVRMLEEGAQEASPEAAWAWMGAAGVAANLLGDAPAALRWLQSALGALESMGKSHSLAAALTYAEIARAYYHLGAPSSTIEAGNRALQLARAVGSRVTEAHTYQYLGLASIRLRDYDYARQHLQTALDSFTENGQSLGRARVLDSLGNLELRLAHYEEAERLLVESLSEKEELQDLRGLALTCGGLARLYTYLAQYDRALEYVRRARELSAQVGDERSATHMCIQMAALHLRNGQPAMARVELGEACRRARQHSDARLEAYACFQLAAAERDLGDMPAALEAVRDACRYFAASEDAIMRYRALLRQALLEGAGLDAPEVREPLDRLRAQADPAIAADALLEVATALWMRQETEHVAQLYAEALDYAETPQADQFAAIIRSRAQSAEGRAWVDAMLAVKEQKDRLERAYGELRRAETLRDSLTQMIVHDLKNPLTAITPLLETIQTVELTPKERAEFLQTAVDECHYLLQMIEELNLVGKIQAGAELELQREPVDLAALMADVARRMGTRAREAGLAIRMEAGPELPAIEADRAKLQRVLENLLANALKYGRPPAGSARPAEVCLSARQEEGTVRVEIRDFGPGIPAAETERIFEPYYQAEAGRKRKAGVGLGLTFCRMVVRAHGGVLWTEPNAEGGTIFAFRLPLA
jgi:signal transduction histidine kinase